MLWTEDADPHIVDEDADPHHVAEMQIRISLISEGRFERGLKKLVISLSLKLRPPEDPKINEFFRKCYW